MARDETRLRFRISQGDAIVRVERHSLPAIRLGTGPASHVRLDDEEVSHMHAVIEVAGPDDVCIIDLGSSTGTFVNGHRVNKAALHTGDTIVVGKTRIEVAIDLDDGEPVASVPTSPVRQPLDSMFAFTFSLHKLKPALDELMAEIKGVYDRFPAASTTAAIGALVREQLLPAFEQFLATQARLAAFVESQIASGAWAPAVHLDRIHALTAAFRTARDRYMAILDGLAAWRLTLDDVRLEMGSIATTLADAFPHDDP